jgi:Xaa-Pro aminopeptidase
MHESPFFDTADHTIIEPGMVFTVEPGIYVPGFAGFRHSDTILVTENGIEMLTYYPRDLEELIIPA